MMTGTNLKIIAMIPARMGSTRLKKKNLAMINGRPMVAYAIEAAIQSKIFDEVYLNSEDDYFEKVANDFGAKFYLRPKDLGNSNVSSDQVVEDFMLKHPCDITAWVNSVSPLQTSDEISNVVSYFVQNEFDSLITTHLEQVHCLFQGNPLNYVDGLFAQTQNLKPVERFVYSIMIWRNHSFLKHMQNYGHALMGGVFGTYPVSKQSAIIVKTESDFELVEAVMRGRDLRKNEKLLNYYGETII